MARSQGLAWEKDLVSPAGSDDITRIIWRKKCLLCACMPAYGMAWSDETHNCFFGSGWWSRGKHTHTQTEHERWTRANFVRRTVRQHITLLTLSLIKKTKHSEAAGSFNKATSWLLCHMWILVMLFIYIFSGESHPPRPYLVPFLDSHNMSESLDQWKRQLFVSLHNVAVSHVSCYLVRQLKFTTNACFNLLPHCSGIRDKLPAVFMWEVGRGKLVSVFHFYCILLFWFT